MFEFPSDEPPSQNGGAPMGYGLRPDERCYRVAQAVVDMDLHPERSLLLSEGCLFMAESEPKRVGRHILTVAGVVSEIGTGSEVDHRTYIVIKEAGLASHMFARLLHREPPRSAIYLTAPWRAA